MLQRTPGQRAAPGGSHLRLARSLALLVCLTLAGCAPVRPDRIVATVAAGPDAGPAQATPPPGFQAAPGRTGETVAPTATAPEASAGILAGGTGTSGPRPAAAPGAAPGPAPSATPALDGALAPSSPAGPGRAGSPLGAGEPTAASGRAEIARYVVAPGDTVFGIAAAYGVTGDTLLAANPGLRANPDRLMVGQELLVPTVSGLVHRVAAGDSLAGLADRYGVSAATVAAANGLEVSGALPVGQLLVVPGGRDPAGAALALAGDGLTPRPQLDSRSGRGEISLPPGLAGYQADFLGKAIAPAQESQRSTGVPASVTLAQAILESDWGRSRLSTEGQNYFGIKASTKPGPAGVIQMTTYEAGIGYVVAPFRAYRTMEESFVDHALFFVENPRYAGALAVKGNARAFASAIARAGYATAPNYASALLNLMDRFGLERYDRP